MEDEQRRKTLVELLDHWRDFFEEPSEPTTLVASDDGKLPEEWSLFSSMQRWPSVVELERCLGVLERLGRGRNGTKTPIHYTHLMAYTAYVEWRLVDRTVKVRAANGKLVEKVERVRERIVPRCCKRKNERGQLVDDLRVVESALDFLLGLWDRRVALELPPAFGRKLHEYVTESGEHGWTEAA